MRDTLSPRLPETNPVSHHPSHETPAPDHASLPALAARSAAGGALMGLANLVPGVSGGTMLLAAGVYTRFVTAISDITRLRFRLRSVIVLGCVVGAALLAILLLAAQVKDLVVERRWIMFSLFIGLTLGGVPLVLRMARPRTPPFFAGAIVGFALMVAMAFLSPGGGGDAGTNSAMLFVAGLAGAAAMILPGVSGGYLLLVLGQYVPILGAIDLLKQGLQDLSGDGVSLILEAMHVVIPVGLGVVAGVVGVSNLIRRLLERQPQPTLGVLFGLLLGAVVGLWPFQRPVEPLPGAVIKGVAQTPETIALLKPEDWPLERFSPTPAHIGGSLALIAAGFALTLLIDRLGAERPKKPRPSS